MGWQDAPEVVSPSSEKSGWQSAPEVSGNLHPGEAEAIKDAALVAKERGITPDELKTFLYSAGDTALFNAPTYAAALANKKKDQSFTDALNEQRAYVEALQRQNPKSSMAGTGAGFFGGMFVPLGPIAKGGQLAARGAEAIGAGAKGKAIASGAGTGAGFGAVSGVSEKFGTEDFTPGEIAKSTAFGAGAGAVLTPIAEKILASKVSPENAARAEILASQGVPASREMITGVKAPEGAARETATQMAQEAKDILTKKVEGMKTPDVSPFAGAEAFQGAERKAFEAAQEPLAKLDKMPGIIDFGYTVDPVTRQVKPNNPVEYIAPFVSKSIESSKINPNFRELQQNYPAANSALNTLSVELSSMANKGNNLTLEQALVVKKELNKAYNSARTVDDKRAVMAIVDGYRDSIKQAVVDGMFTGNQLPAVVELARADKGWSQFEKMYGSGKGSESSVWNRIKKAMSDERGYVTSNLTPDKAQAAQEIINESILKPRVGPVLYNRLEKAIGAGTPAMDSFNALIRNNMLTVKGDDITKLPDQINKYTSQRALPVTLKAHGADTGNLTSLAPHPSDSAQTAAAKARLTDAQKMAQAIELVNKSAANEAEKQSAFVQVIKQYGPALVGSAFGMPHGAEAIAYGVLGKSAGAVGSGAMGAFESAAQRSGAPKMVMPDTAGQPIPVGKFNVTPRAYLPSLAPPDQEPNYGLPQARASGGRVMTSNDLMAAMERNGKKDVQNTKPLLNSTDDAVAKALEIANQHI